MMFWEEAQRKKLFPDVKEIVQMVCLELFPGERSVCVDTAEVFLDA